MLMVPARLSLPYGKVHMLTFSYFFPRFDCHLAFCDGVWTQRE